jgi:hypothetical protein
LHRHLSSLVKKLGAALHRTQLFITYLFFASFIILCQLVACTKMPQQPECPLQGQQL